MQLPSDLSYDLNSCSFVFFPYLQAPFRGNSLEKKASDATKYCLTHELLADYTALSCIAPGFMKVKIAGIVTCVPREQSEFKKAWSRLVIITDPSLEVVDEKGQEAIREMKAHLFSNEKDAYPEIHRGDIVFMKQVQCEISPFGPLPRPVDVRIFSCNDFTVVCCHPEMDIADSHPRPSGRVLYTHQLKLGKFIYNWSRKKKQKLPLLFSQIPAVETILQGQSVDYGHTASATFTNIPALVTTNGEACWRPYIFYLYSLSCEWCDINNTKVNKIVLTDGGIILPRDIDVAYSVKGKNLRMVTNLNFFLPEDFKEAFNVSVEPGHYYKFSNVYISDRFNAYYLSLDLLPVLNLMKNSKVQEINRNHHMAALIRERLNELPEVIESYENFWKCAYSKVEDSQGSMPTSSADL
ncbi:hypothetical protein QYM36_006189 [Artemia franciscana]|uniref:Uncharacterized protein n=1 Tax=Artemia franciscana TaxID=6661 RepID=A0AA88HWV6_ARTSF|nr:hypothetical protein QYM36_006189 [Artemia franciscana]